MLECSPAMTDYLDFSLDKYNSYERELETIHMDKRTWRWPKASILELDHLIDIDVAPDPTKIAKNLYSFPA